MPQLDTTCPSCDAPFARRLSLVHSEGVSTSQSTTNATGTINTVGRHRITTVGASVGQSQTQRSRLIAPPDVPPLVWTAGAKIQLILRVVGTWIALLAPIAATNTFGSFLGMVLLLLSFVWGSSFLIRTSPTESELAIYNQNTEVQRKALQDWESTFSCSACGHQFIPPANTN